MKRTLITLAALVAIAFPAAAEWRKIGDGPSFEQAYAYCDNAALGMRQPGWFAFGNSSFVGGYALGSGLGRVIRRHRYRNNCMVMMGWKNVRTTRKTARPRTNFNTGGNVNEGPGH